MMTEKQFPQPAGSFRDRIQCAPDTVRFQMICSVMEAEPVAYFTYGLQCLGRYDGAWVQLDVIQDLSTDRDYVLRLADRFQQLQLSPLHFRDAVMDEVNM